MSDRDIIQGLIDYGDVQVALRRGSAATGAIRALQTLLHEVGFGKELKWDKYGADGEYGRSTSGAVRLFATRNGLNGDGEKVTAAVAATLLARHDCLGELQRLNADIQAGNIDTLYRRRSAHEEAIAALQTLLHELGFDAELRWSRYGADGNYGGSTVRAVRAFARQQGIASDGGRLTSALARRIVANLRPRYGDEWSTVTLTPAAAYSKLRTREIQRGGKTWVAVIDGRQEKRFRRFKKGLFTSGNCPPLRFIETSGAKLRAAGLTDSAIAVMLSVAENEGSLDAINTWDNAFLSFGMFQWTAGTTNGKGELAAFLERLKASAPEAFAEYFGCHGLGVTDSNGVYGHLTVKGRRLSSAAVKEQLRAPEWAFRFWLAGQDPEVQAVEIQHALSRLEGFYNTDRYTVRGGHRVAELVSSEYGVALLLDNHVNRPAYVKGCLGGALKQTGLPPPQDWGTEEEARLLKAYLRIRRGYGNSPMTDAAKRAAVTRRYLDDGTVSAERHSFQRGRG